MPKSMGETVALSYTTIFTSENRISPGNPGFKFSVLR